MRLTLSRKISLVSPIYSSTLFFVFGLQNMSTMRRSDNIISCIDPIGAQFKTKDPFLFCAYHKDSYPGIEFSIYLTTVHAFPFLY